jgi:methylated-DNA-[protein]-cysteine S-methyltransferase
MTYHIIFATRFGHASVIYRQKPFAAIKIFLPCKDRESLVEALETMGCGDPDSHYKAVIVKELIIDYFKGKPIQPPWKWMDMDGLTKLQQSVLVATADIPFGELRSYKEIAETVNRPRAYRFVGTTLANNPFPILIPCHRVIRSDASFGQFGGGTDLKRKLIELEARYL